MNKCIFKLNDICDISGGYAFKSTIFKDNGIPIIRIGDISDNKINISETTVYINENIEKYKNFIISKGDILIALSGATTGKFGIYNYDEPSLLNQRVAKLFPKKDVLNKYLYHYMNKLQDTIYNKALGCAQPNISPKEIGELEIYLPNINEQKAIVEVLDKAQELIDKRKKQIEALDELVKSKFIEMFGDPVQNPLGWQLKPFLDSGNCKNGMNFSATETGVELQYLGVGDFKDLSKIEDVNNLGKVSLNKMPSTEYLLQDGDIVFVRSNGNKALVGRCLAVYPNGIPTTYSGFCIRYRKTDKSLEIPYLLQVLKTDSMRKNMAGRGANIQNLNQQILGELMIPIPPIELQNQFADFVKQVDKLKFEMEKSLKELEDNFNSLMEKAFNEELLK